MNGEGNMKDETRRWRRVLDNKKNRNSHALELTRRHRHSSLVSYFVSLSFLLVSIVIPSQQERGSCDARGRKTGRLRARVRKKDEARQAQSISIVDIVIREPLPRMRATKKQSARRGEQQTVRICQHMTADCTRVACRARL